MIFLNVNYQKIQLELLLQKYFEGSPLIFVSVNDVIVELQKKKITNQNNFLNLVKEIINKKEKHFI